MFGLTRTVATGAGANWWRSLRDGPIEPIHVMHVLADEGIEGVCTVGDVRYRTMTERELEQLRAIVVGADLDQRK